jgi:hypothetical protein
MQEHLASVAARVSRALFASVVLFGATACHDSLPAPSYSIGGTVRNSAGEPISGATVTIVTGPFAGKSTTTTPSGTYVLGDLHPSSFTVSVSSNNYISQSASVTLKSNQVLDFGLGPVGSFSITGTVRDASFRPIVNANVTIVGGPNNGRTTKTDSSGIFGFTGVEPSSFIISVTSGDWAPTSVVMTLPGDLVADVIMKYPPFVLTGQVVVADTASPIRGVTIFINGRYSAVSDDAGRYSVTGALDGGSLTSFGNYAFTSASGYEPEYRFVRTASQDFHLRPSQRMTAGASTSVTVSPTDTICVNNVQDDPSLYGAAAMVCRTVRVIAPSDGLLTVEAVSSGGAHPQMEAEALIDAHCCTLENLGNPWSQRVTAGTEVRVNVEIPASSATSQTFLVQTSMSAEHSEFRRRSP